MKQIFLLAAFSAAAFAQSPIFVINIGGGGGSSYTSSATVSLSGGTFTSAATLGAPVIGAGGTITSIPITYAGIYSVAPSVVITANGAGSGATATASLLPYGGTINVTATSIDPAGSLLSSTGTFIGVGYECLITVPAALVTTYKTNASPAPGTSQSSGPMNAAVASGTLTPTNFTMVENMIADLTAGILTVFDGKITGLPSSTTLTTMEGLVSANCTSAQAMVNGWNPSPYNGSFFNLLSGAWTTVSTQ